MQYLVIAYDNANALERRLESRDEHVEGVRKLMAEGKIINAAALMEEDFYEEAKLWRYTAQKEVFVCRGKEKIEANIVLKLCEYKGYSAIYAVIDYGFENSDVWEQTREAWLNIKNRQTPEA